MSEEDTSEPDEDAEPLLDGQPIFNSKDPDEEDDDDDDGIYLG